MGKKLRAPRIIYVLVYENCCGTHLSVDTMPFMTEKAARARVQQWNKKVEGEDMRYGVKKYRLIADRP